MKRPIVTSVLVLFAVLLSGLPVWAGVSPQPFRTGLFGIAAGQGIRVSVLNAADDGGGTINPCFHPPDPVIAKVAIRRLDGLTLFESLTPQLPGGVGAFVDYAPDFKALSATATLSQSRRLQVRAEVSFTEEDLVRIQACGVALTLEVFDMVTGRTGFTMPFAAVMFNPQPEPPEPVASDAGEP